MVSLFGFHPTWLLINFVAVSLNTANLFGYIRARFLNSSTSDDGGQGSGANAWNRMTSKIQEQLASLFTMTTTRHKGGGYSKGRYTQMDTEGNV